MPRTIRPPRRTRARASLRNEAMMGVDREDPSIYLREDADRAAAKQPQRKTKKRKSSKKSKNAA